MLEGKLIFRNYCTG